MSAYTVSRLALEAGVSVHIVRDYTQVRWDSLFGM